MPIENQRLLTDGQFRGIHEDLSGTGKGTRFALKVHRTERTFEDVLPRRPDEPVTWAQAGQNTVKVLLPTAASTRIVFGPAERVISHEQLFSPVLYCSKKIFWAITHDCFPALR